MCFNIENHLEIQISSWKHPRDSRISSTQRSVSPAQERVGCFLNTLPAEWASQNTAWVIKTSSAMDHDAVTPRMSVNSSIPVRFSVWQLPLQLALCLFWSMMTRQMRLMNSVWGTHGVRDLCRNPSSIAFSIWYIHQLCYIQCWLACFWLGLLAVCRGKPLRWSCNIWYTI